MAYLVGIIFGSAILVASGYADWSPEAIGRSDFAKFWVGPRAVLSGLDPFEASTWPETARQLGATAVNWPDYGYFGWTIVVLLPFAVVPLDVAFKIWTVGGIAAAATAVAWLLRRSLPGHAVAHTLVGMTLIASHPARLTVLLGQWGFVLCAALAAIIMWTRGARPAAAGTAATFLLAKPQLFVLGAPALAAWCWHAGQRRAIAAAVLAGGSLAGLSLILLPGWPAAWLRDIPSRALSAEPQTTTLASALYAIGGPPGTVLAFAILLGGVVLALRFDPRGDAWLAVWLPLSIVAAPYVWSYDQTTLVIPLVLGAGVVARRSYRSATLVIAAGCSLLLVASTMLAVVAARRNIESYSAVIPLLVFVLLVSALWRARHDDDGGQTPKATGG